MKKCNFLIWELGIQKKKGNNALKMDFQFSICTIYLVVLEKQKRGKNWKLSIARKYIQIGDIAFLNDFL